MNGHGKSHAPILRLQWFLSRELTHAQNYVQHVVLERVFYLLWITINLINLVFLYQL